MQNINLTNHFLIAMPAMADPNFSRAVAFIAEHGEDGAIGLIINRPIDLTVKDLREPKTRDFVRSLYRAFWADGADLSDPAVLDRLAEAAGLTGLQPDEDDTATAREWRRNWERTGLGGVPLIIRADGKPLYGLVDSEQLAAFL